MAEDRQMPGKETGAATPLDGRGKREPDLAEIISAWYRVARAQSASSKRTDRVVAPGPAVRPKGET